MFVRVLSDSQPEVLSSVLSTFVFGLETLMLGYEAREGTRGGAFLDFEFFGSLKGVGRLILQGLCRIFPILF